MPEQIMDRFFRIEVPMPNNPLKYLNSYIIVGEPDTRNLMVDTGFNLPESLEKVYSSLEELDVHLDETDFFITHFHADHCGLVGQLAADSSTVFMGKPDRDIFLSVLRQKNREVPLPSQLPQSQFHAAKIHGFPRDDLETVKDYHPTSVYPEFAPERVESVHSGDELNYGPYEFRCIETPGHTVGHTCLFLQNHQLLISGDHVLGDVTPNISVFLEKYERLLIEYLQSLQKIRDMDIRLVLPGHRRTLDNPVQRIDELLDHHQGRLKEVLNNLNESGKTAYEISKLLSWDIDYDCWEGVHPIQRWFALGETVAHLKYLVIQGTVNEHKEHDKINYHKVLG